MAINTTKTFKIILKINLFLAIAANAILWILWFRIYHNTAIPYFWFIIGLISIMILYYFILLKRCIKYIREHAEQEKEMYLKIALLFLQNIIPFALLEIAARL